MSDLTIIHDLKAHVGHCLDDLSNVKETLDELFEARGMSDQEVSGNLMGIINKQSETLQSVAQLKPQLSSVLAMVNSIKVLPLLTFIQFI